MPFALLRALRPKQWLKNGLLFAALIFSGHALDLPFALRALVGALIFCAVASGLYLVNDLTDIEKDREHPRKRHRPLASGDLSVPVAQVAAVLLIAGGVGVALWYEVVFGSIVLAYALLTLAYCWYLQNIVLLDVFILASGFVFRAVAGAVIINVDVSEWLFICTLLLSLFLALSKRRAEISLLGDLKGKHRAVLEHYSPRLLDQMISAVTGATMVCYSLYTMWPETVERIGGSTNLKYTIPFVILGLFRYLYLVHQKEEGGAPEQVLLTDKGLILIILGWVTTCLVVIYHAKVFPA